MSSLSYYICICLCWPGFHCSREPNNLIMYRRNFNEILDVMLYDDSSTDDSSSSDEDDVGTLLVEMAFAPKVTLGRHMNLADLTDSECEQMFR